MRAGHCRCCGIGLDGQGPVRDRVRVCIGCDECDELHGAVLQGVLARALIDDAQLTGRTVYVVKEGAPSEIRIPNPPPRWMVVCGRALARGEQPDLHSVVDAVLQRYFGSASTRIAELRAELRDAITFVDPSIFDVEVSTTLDVLDPGHLVIEVKAKTPTIGTTMAEDADAVIPPDIMSRKRAEA